MTSNTTDIRIMRKKKKQRERKIKIVKKKEKKIKLIRLCVLISSQYNQMQKQRN